MKKRIIIAAGLIISTVITGCGYTKNAIKEEQKSTKQKSTEYEERFTADTRVKDVMNDPAFAGYGRLIFPVDMEIKKNLKLEDVEEILPWYSEVNPEKTVEIVNDMKDQAVRGEQIFYDIYSEEEKREDPEKEIPDYFSFVEMPEKRQRL